MSDEDWLVLDSSHIMSTEDAIFTCSNCGKEYLYIRDRCPFCHIIKQAFNNNGQWFYIVEHNLYTAIDNKWYVYNKQTHEYELTPFEIEEPNQPVQNNYSQQPPKTSFSSGNWFEDMISTTIVVAILFILFVAIVYFLDMHVFHGA